MKDEVFRVLESKGLQDPQVGSLAFYSRKERRFLLRGKYQDVEKDVGWRIIATLFIFPILLIFSLFDN